MTTPDGAEEAVTPDSGKAVMLDELANDQHYGEFALLSASKTAVGSTSHHSLPTPRRRPQPAKPLGTIRRRGTMTLPR